MSSDAAIQQQINELIPADAADLKQLQANRPIKHISVFDPLPGSQTMLMSCPADHICLIGSRGSGKTESQLAFFRKYVGMGYGSSHTGVVIGVSYKNLQDSIAKAVRLYGKFGDGGRMQYGTSLLSYRWPTGEKLLFRVVNSIEQYNSIIHGNEFSQILWNEVCEFSSLEILDMCHSALRHSFVPERDSPRHPKTGEIIQVLPELPTVSIAAGNPHGRLARDVRERYLPNGPSDYGRIQKVTQEIFNPRSGQIESQTRTQCALFSSWVENIHLPPSYGAELASITDPKLRKAWLLGSFSDDPDNTIVGDVFNKDKNIVPNFLPPSNWQLIHIYDHGEAAPFEYAIVAISDGKPANIGGKLFDTVKGDLFVIAEDYGWSGKRNKGLKLLGKQIAQRMIGLQLDLGVYGNVKAGPADTSIFNNVNGRALADDFIDPVTINGRQYRGPDFIPADKSRGSRSRGYMLLRTALANASDTERTKPALFICERCSDGIIRTLPTLERDPKNQDDTPSNAEDHCFTANTKVLLADGSTPTIESLIGKTGLIATDEGPQPFYGARLIEKNQKTITLTFSDGSTVQCTPDHEFYIADGSIVEAKDLPLHTPLKTVDQKNNQLTSIVESSSEDVYCLTVPTIGRFSLANGVMVSNCADALRYLVMEHQDNFSITNTKNYY